MKESSTRVSKSAVMKPRRCPAAVSLRIPTIELKRTKSLSLTAYDQLCVSDVEQDLFGKIIHSSLDMEKRAGAGKPVILIGESDEHGAAAFVRRAALLHGDVIRNRCIPSPTSLSLVRSNHGDSNSQNHDISVLIKQAAAAFASYPNPSTQPPLRTGWCTLGVCPGARTNGITVRGN